MFWCDDNRTDVDSHNYLNPICVSCKREENDWEHREDNSKHHQFISPLEPLEWGKNAHQHSHCNTPVADENNDRWIHCECPCHWHIYYVNVYEIDRQFGGNEEGGWWYDSGEPVASIPCDTWKEAEDLREVLYQKYPHTGKSSSVIYDGGDYSIAIEKSFGMPYPEERPHYE